MNKQKLLKDIQEREYLCDKVIGHYYCDRVATYIRGTRAYCGLHKTEGSNFIKIKNGQAN